MALLAGLALGVLLWQAWQAQTALQAARERVVVLREVLAAGELGQAEQELTLLQRDSAAARGSTEGRLWDAAGAVPLLGRSAESAQRLTGTVDELSRAVLPELLAAARLVSPEHLRTASDQLDLAAIAAAEAPLERADRRLSALRSGAARPYVLPPVARAEDDLVADVARLRAAVGRGLAAARALPAALGADGPRRYLLAFQTNAESRGTGGLVGAYGILVADRGRLSVPVVGSDTDISATPARVALGEEYAELYGPHPALWGNTNLSPHFPYAARLWLDVWQQQTGEHLDGALATDPVALAHLLEATGEVRLPEGELVTADNAVALTEWDAYGRFDGDNDARRAFLVRVARAVVDAVLHAPEEPRALAGALATSAAEGRLLLYSVHPAEQAALTGTALSGELATGPAPFAAVIVNNAAGNKLDYHLRREVRYELDACGSDRRTSRVLVRLTNDVPSGPLPAYASGRNDLPPRTPFVRGSNRLHVGVYATVGAALLRAELDGQPIAVQVGSERGRPVFVSSVELAPQQSRHLVLHLVEPPAAGAPRLHEQPLVLAQRSQVQDAGCAGHGRAVSAAG